MIVAINIVISSFYVTIHLILIKGWNMQDNSEIINKLKQIIKQKCLKYTKQREVIFETILNCKKHLGAEEL